MREVFDGFLCELDSCCKELIDNNTPCADCGHCIDSILYAEAEAEAMLKDAGYTEFDPKASYQPGDKVYFNNRGKAIIASTFGTAPLDEGIRLNAAHIDAPRLDLKPTPVYEKNDIAYFKTH